MELELAQRKAILASQVGRWPKATKQERGEILDAICQVTDWHRDHARKMIRQRVAGIEPGPRKAREPVASLRAHGRLDVTEETIEALLRMSPATIDRRLQPYRSGLVASKGICHTRPGSMLKASIPMKTWAQWDHTEPGFVQIDLVGHEGGDNNGQFHWSLDMTDIATGWTEAISIHSKGERVVRAGLEQLQLRLPFAIRVKLHPP